MSSIAQRSFTAGEVSPSLYARTDLQRYTQGLRTCRNFLVQRDGGITNRPGTEYVDDCANGASAVRVIPFIVSADIAYCLEFSDALIRVFEDGADTGVSIVSPYAAGDLFEIRFAQSAGVMTLCHPDYPVYELTRADAVTWSMAAVTFAPAIAAPANLTTSGGSTVIGIVNWVVTAVNASGAESLVSNNISVEVLPPRLRAHAPVTLSWDTVTGAVGYVVYKGYVTLGTGTVSSYGYIGTTTAPEFYDDGIEPDDARQPIRTLSSFSGGAYPSAVGGYQQRRIFAGTTAQPETFWASRAGDAHNITRSVPVQDDDAIEATLVSDRVTDLRHVVGGDGLFLLAGGGEWKIQGDGAGVLRPTDINALQFSRHGSSLLPPIVIDRRILFVQARQSIVRQIVSNEVGPGYVGANLTLLSSHLFKGYTLSDWAYCEEPFSVIWCVRSDGTLLALTDLEEDGQQTVLAWSRHDTDGLVESVCAVPEGSEHRLYLVVNRDGTRMLERMGSRYATDTDDLLFMDSAVSHDGRNTTSETMALSGSTTWAYDELVTVTRSVGGFTSGNVGDRVDFVDSDGVPLTVTLTAYTSGTVMQGFPNRTVPAELQGAGTTAWTLATATISGLSHLEGKAVSVLGDGYVVASPNNPSYATTVTVSGGVATLPEPYGYVHVGLPYLVDAETLDIDTPSGPSLKAGKMLVKTVTAYVEASRSFFAGQSLPDDDAADVLEHMDEAVIRDVSDDYGPTRLTTDTLDVTIPSSWNSNGRIAIRHVDPSPLTLLALIPRGEIG